MACKNFSYTPPYEAKAPEIGSTVVRRGLSTAWLVVATAVDDGHDDSDDHGDNYNGARVSCTAHCLAYLISDAVIGHSFCLFQFFFYLRLHAVDTYYMHACSTRSIHMI